MYRVIIKKVEEYNVKSYRYEGTDGKRYNSTYGVPEGVEYKKVEYETGETAVNEIEVFDQNVDELDVTEVIKAVNKIK